LTRGCGSLRSGHVRGTQPRRDEPFERARGHTDTGGDEIRIKVAGTRRGGDLDKVAPNTWLAAGEMDLQHAERRRLLEHPSPSRSVKFTLTTVKRQRVGAVWTAEGAPVR